MPDHHHRDNLMKLTVCWYAKFADVIFEDYSAAMKVSCLNQAERNALAEHLREIADELSPTTETP